jgi:hypothetical protein
MAVSRSRATRRCCAVATFILALTTSVVVPPTAHAATTVPVNIATVGSTGVVDPPCVSAPATGKTDAPIRSGECAMQAAWLDIRETVNGQTVHTFESKTRCIDTKNGGADKTLVVARACDRSKASQQWIWTDRQLRNLANPTQCLTIDSLAFQNRENPSEPRTAPSTYRISPCVSDSAFQAFAPLVPTGALAISVAIEGQSVNADLRITLAGRTALGNQMQGESQGLNASFRLPTGFYALLVSARIGSSWAPIDVVDIRSPFGGVARRVYQGTAVERITVSDPPPGVLMVPGSYKFIVHVPATG